MLECNENQSSPCVLFVLTQKAGVEFDAVSVGAILSDYQRVRVEHV